MAIKYVSATTGSNANDGNTVGTPYLTITYAVSQIVTGDTIEVAAGTYQERFSTGDKAITFSASGAVIVDGNSGVLAAPAITFNNSTATRQYTITRKSGTTGTWTFQNFGGAGDLLASGASPIGTNVSCAYVTLNGGNNNAYGLRYYNGNNQNAIVFTACAFTGFINGCIYMLSTNGACTCNITNCTFTSSPTINTYGLSVNLGTFNWSNNTFTYISYPFLSTGIPVITASNNTYIGAYGWGVSNSFRTWASWKTQSANSDTVGSTSDSIGLSYYVNKSGNNANNGSGPSSARLTIQSGISLLTFANEFLTVGSGTYNESITLPSTVAGCALYADGTVILDGTGLGNVALINSGQRVAAITTSSTGGKWIFKNCGGSAIGKTQGAFAASQGLYFTNCEFISSNNDTGFVFSSAAQGTFLSFNNCIFSGFSSTGINYTASNGAYVGSLTVTNCTFANNGMHIYFTQAGINLTPTITAINNIFYNSSSYSIVFAGPSLNHIPAFQGNQYYGIGTGWYKAPNAYATLADWQALGYDRNSITADPNFEDAPNGILYLKTASSLGRNVGAIPFGFTTGSNNSDATWIITAIADNTGWYNADGNVTKNVTTGDFELTSGTSGTIVSPVYDLGSVQTIKGINLAVEQAWGTNMIDTTTSDVRPNYQTVEVRASGSTFNQDAVSPSWNEVKTEQPITLISGRYVQLRLILRSDDVAA